MKIVLCLLIGWFAWQLFIAIKKRKIYTRKGPLHERDNQQAFRRTLFAIVVWLSVLICFTGLLVYHPHFGPESSGHERR